MLALYLVWHLRRAWAPICFADEDPALRADPVAPARRSAAALAKVRSKRGDDGEPLHSFATLVDALAALTRNTIVFSGGARVTKLSAPTALQRRAAARHPSTDRAQADVVRNRPREAETPAQQAGLRHWPSNFGLADGTPHYGCSASRSDAISSRMSGPKLSLWM